MSRPSESDATTVAGGLLVLSLMSYLVAPVALHVSVGAVATAVAPVTGLGVVGEPGPMVGTLAVFNHHTGPSVDPMLLRATIRQKYRVPAASVG